MTPPSTGPVAVATPTAVPIRPNARPRSHRGNICCTSPDTCGLSSPPARPCSTRPATSTAGFGARPDHRAEPHERGDPDLQHQPPAAVVAEPAADDRHHPERQRVAGDHPLQLGRPGADVPADRHQRDVDDADVEQRDVERADAGTEGPPAPRVRLADRPVAGHDGGRYPAPYGGHRDRGCTGSEPSAGRRGRGGEGRPGRGRHPDRGGPVRRRAASCSAAGTTAGSRTATRRCTARPPRSAPPAGSRRTGGRRW